MIDRTSVLGWYNDIVDFESGFTAGDATGTVVSATNVVTFSVTGGGPGFISKVGLPRTSFSPADTPAAGDPGAFFLSDEFSDPPAMALDYFMSFASPVASVSLDLFDYRHGGLEPPSTTSFPSTFPFPKGRNGKPLSGTGTFTCTGQRFAP